MLNLTITERKEHRRIQKLNWQRSHRKYEKTVPLAGRIKYWINGAKARNISWAEDLTLEYLESLPKVCHYTGKKLSFDKCKDNTISLDRIDSSKGYSRDNIVFCCSAVNFMKSDMDVNKFIKWCKLISRGTNG